MDIDHTVLLGGIIGGVVRFLFHCAVVLVHHIGAVIDVLVLILLIRAKKLFLEVTERHKTCSFHSSGSLRPGVFCKRMQIAYPIICFFFADVNNYKSFPLYKFCPETIISSYSFTSLMESLVPLGKTRI